MGRDVKHVSIEEKKNKVFIIILICILIVIFFSIIIIMIPKNKTKTTENQAAKNDINTDLEKEENDSQGDELNQIDKDGNKIERDKNRVSITIKPETLTIYGAVIVITDTNKHPYSWTPSYRIQEKTDDEWKDMELKSPENALFTNIENDNPTGVMEQSLVWANKYGQLETGEYRIVKESNGIEFYAEFQVQ